MVVGGARCASVLYEVSRCNRLITASRGGEDVVRMLEVEQRGISRLTMGFRKITTEMRKML